MKLYKTCTLSVILCVFQVIAVEVHSPDEELASETVLPVFNPPQYVFYNMLSGPSVQISIYSTRKASVMERVKSYFLPWGPYLYKGYYAYVSSFMVLHGFTCGYVEYDWRFEKNMLDDGYLSGMAIAIHKLWVVNPNQKKIKTLISSFVCSSNCLTKIEKSKKEKSKKGNDNYPDVEFYGILYDGNKKKVSLVSYDAPVASTGEGPPYYGCQTMKAYTGKETREERQKGLAEELLKNGPDKSFLFF